MMEIQNKSKRQHRTYIKPMCSMLQVEMSGIVAASPGESDTPPILKPPTSETTDPNSAKQSPHFDAWETWK